VQTIKTTAIIIFMGTVMYGAYTSLTTRPEQLPPDVQELVFDNEPSVAFDEESFDKNLAGGLPELEINTGQPVDELAVSDQEPADDPDNPTNELAMPADEDQSVVTARLSDAADGTPSQSSPADSPAYAVTPNTYELPDPDSVASSFEPSAGDVNLPNTESDLALTSGTSESSGAVAVPENAEVMAESTPPKTNVGVVNAIRTADRQYAEDQRREALATLSIFYNAPNLSGQQRADLLARLDPLAREVIYSREHLLAKPYRVAHDETLVDIAQQYQVPWQLLANINQVTDPMAILPGTELKVVQGPFRAEINLATEELTLFLGDLYAGRFPIAIGNDPPPQPGTFTVQDKQAKRTYYDRSGSAVPPGSPNNPYGKAWLDLGGQLCIHGSPEPTQPTDRGCISLADNYAADLLGILSHGSAVTIRR